MRLTVGIALLGLSCGGSPPSVTAKAAPVVARPSASAPRVWYPMGDAAVPIPADCTAKCTLDCDVWSGQMECAGDPAPLSVYGGISSMAGMELDQRGARQAAERAMADGTRMRWRTARDGRHCSVVARGAWTWELCGAAASSERIAGIMGAYGPKVPKTPLIECEQTGC